MKILIINVDNQPELIGGIKKVFLLLAREWIKRRIGVEIVCYCTSNNRCNNINGIKQYFFPDPVEYCCEKNLQFIEKIIQEDSIDIIYNPFCEQFKINTLLVLLRKQMPIRVINVLHFSPDHFDKTYKYNFFIKEKVGESICALMREYIYYVYYLLKGKRKVRKLTELMLCSAFKSSDVLVTLSERYVKDLRDKFNYRNLLSISNPIDSKKFIVSVKEKIVLWAGRVEFGTKRTDRILKIWNIIANKIPDWKLYIAGSGDATIFKKMVEKNNIINVHFLGFINDMNSLYKKSSIICVTSNDEGWGMTLVEGMQMGCVPLAFGSYKSIYDIIEDGYNGFVIKPFENIEYAEKILLLARNEKLRNNFSQTATISVKKFEAEKISQSWIKLFNEILSIDYE